MKLSVSLSKDKKYLIHSAVGLILMFGFGFLPEMGPLSHLGMQMVGIMIGLIYLWTFVEMVWPSIAGLVALAMTGTMTIGEICTTGFGNSTVWLAFFSMTICVCVTNSGVLDYFIPWLLKKDFLKGHPWRLTIGLIFGGFLLSSLGSGIAMLFIMWEIVYKISEKAGMERKHPWCGAMIVACTVGIVYGSMAFPFKGIPLFVLGIYQVEVPFLTYTAFIWVAVILTIILAIVGMRFVLRVDVTVLKEVDASEFGKVMEPMSKTQKNLAFVLGLFIISLIIVGSADMFPDGTFKTVCSKLTPTGISFIFFIILSIYRTNGKSALDIRKVTQQIPWEAIFLLVVAFTFASKLAAPETGLPVLMNNIGAPLLAGRSPLAFLMIFGILSLLLTNIFNNTVIILLMASFVGSYAATIDFSMITVAMLTVILTQMAFFLPSSSIFGSFIYGQSESIGMRAILSNAGMYIAIFIILALVYIVPVANILF